MPVKILTFGELLMRLKTPGLERFQQSNEFEVVFGGAEANVAVSLALFGCHSTFITALPEHPLAQKALSEVKRWGVDTRHAVWGNGRLGLYYMEAGANQRSGQVIYDRSHSAFSNLSAGDVDWDNIMSEVDWFHISGISPAISQSAADISLEAMRAARAVGAKVSLDVNYRSKLWKYGKSPEEILTPMVSLADVLIAGRGDCQQALNIHGSGDPDSRIYFERLTETVLEQFPNLSSIAVTIRDTRSAEHHKWAACFRDREKILFSRDYEIKDIVDRVGSGDAFSAGLIYGLTERMSSHRALEFAAAANCLKHSIVGDFNLVSVDEVLSIVDGEATGRVKR